ncbi:glycosyltransferase family 2 protein [Flavicella sediminum]|uniref:glycosyltransferase family 2 protein n=1 Tax=Flavicella sediminum TaxID=2585141 RepID=UPI00111F3E18|nr:glycosyltransferase family 2 protein [Flavicella sediminum]
MLKIAVVILNWNGKKLLETFLPSVINFSQEAEVYVADNASTDDSVTFIKENFPSVKIVINQENGGFAKGYNDALQHIKADVYALVNSDIEVTENWLQPIIKQFKVSPNTAIIQPKILDYKNKHKFEYAGAAGGFLDILGYPYCRGRIFNVLEKDKGQYNDVIDINWASGACFFIKTDIYHQLGGFDEDYFAHQEEIDLCWRTTNLGHQIKYVGAATVYHVGGATLSEANSFKTFLNFRNSLFSLVKNLPKRKVFLFVLIRMLLDAVAGLRFTLQGRPIHMVAILKSHLSFYKQLPKMIAKRTQNNKGKYYNTFSIVWSHFILNIRKVNKL